MSNRIGLMGFVLIMLFAAISSFAFAADAVNYAYPLEVTATSFLPATIHAGDIVSLAVDVRNRSANSPITDVNARLELGSQFEAIQTDNQVAGIGANVTETIVFKFRVREGTIPGFYPVLLNLDYDSINGPTHQTKSIAVPVSKSEQNLDVTITPSVISPGSRSEMIISLQNVSSTAVSNLSISWEEEDSLILPLGSDNQRYFSILEAGQTQEVKYQVAVDPNIPTGIYPLNVTLEYNDSNGLKTQVTRAGIIIGGKTDFEIGAERTDTQLSVSIANTGSNNANAVVAKIVQTQGITITGSATSILGNLNKGDYTIASFQIQSTVAGLPTTTGTNATGFAGRTNRNDFNANQAMNGTADVNAPRNMAPQVTVEITYTDTTGERQTVQKEIMLSGSSSTTITRPTAGTTGARGGGLNDWILIGTVALAGILFNHFIAKKSWKKVGVVIAIMIAIILALPYLFANGIPVSVFAAVMGLIAMIWIFRESIQERFKKMKKEKK